MAAEIGYWPVEPTILYVFSYYQTNAENEAVSYVSPNMSSYNIALEAAKQYIQDQANIGVCIIQPITATVVYPFVPWEDF